MAYPRQDLSVILGKRITYTYENGWLYELYFKSETELHYRVHSGLVGGRWVTNREITMTGIGHGMVRVNWVEPVGNIVALVINPADPPIIMRDTIHCLTEEAPDEAAITASIHEMVREVQTYVPGYTLKNGPVFDGNRVTVWMEVAGLGDYLPTYAGNLDIMTAAALRTAELLAMRGMA